jgi:hypothetical protein
VRPPVAPPVVPPPGVKNDAKKAIVIEKQPRREFVVLFLWREPLRSLEAATEAKKD